MIKYLRSYFIWTLWILPVILWAQPNDVVLDPPANPGAHTLSLTWSQNADTTFSAYELYRSSSASVTPGDELVYTSGSRADTMFTDSGLHAVTTYYYKVFVVDTSAVRSSGSNEVSEVTNALDFPFFDDMEDSLNLNWFVDAPWGKNNYPTDTTRYSGQYSWTDSPDGIYSSNEDASLLMRLNLATAQMPVLTFQTWYSTQANYDYGRVEVSLNGTSWTVAAYFSGAQSTWKEIRVDLTPWTLNSDVYVRFRFTSNGSTESQGWYIDDVSVDETPFTNLSYPFIDSFDDSTSNDNWHAAQWEILTDSDKSFPGRVHDSPTGYYLRSGTTADYTNDPNDYTSFTSSGVLDLSGAVNPILTFWQKYDIWTTTDGYNTDDDYGRIYISTNKGQPGTWTQIYTVNGTGQTGSWQKVTLDLSAYTVPNVRIRFIMDDNRDTHTTYGDQSEQRDGWWIDDLRIEDRPLMSTLNTPANVTMHGADISWSENTDSDFIYYEIRRATSASVSRSSELIATITDQGTTSYRDNYQVLRPTIYYYRIYVLDSLDNVSLGSNIESADYTVPTVTFPFVDSVETAADTSKWNWGYPWGRTTAKAHSGNTSWTDSPGSAYNPNINTALTTNIDLSGSSTPVLIFWHQYRFETNADYGKVEVSTDGGSTWTEIHSVTGIDTAWNKERIDLEAYVGNTIGLRFRAVSNGSTQMDGWYIDDITITDENRIVGFPFSEDFESGFDNWFVQSPWGLTTDDPHGGSYSMTESPSGAYANNSDVSTVLHIDLTTAEMPALFFWMRHSTQANYDYCRVEVSTNGTDWTVAGYWSGAQAVWQQARIDLTPWTLNPDVSIRWRFTSDGSTTGDGWYIDDISIAETPVHDLSYPFYEYFDDSLTVDRWHSAQWKVVPDGHSFPGRIHDSPTGYYLRSGTTVDYTNNPNNFTSFTMSGVIDMSSAVDPVLTFWQKYDIWTTTDGYNTDDDYARVYISTNKGQPGSWTQLYNVNGTGQTGSWQKITIDLSDYLVPDIRIRFVMDDNRDTHTTYGDQSEQRDGWWIDDIRLEDRATRVVVNAPANVTMHGTDLSWSLNTDNDFNRYEIYRNTSDNVTRSSTLIANISNQNTVSYRDDYQVNQPTTYYYAIYVIDTLETPSIRSNVVHAVYSVPTVTFPFTDMITTDSDTTWNWSTPWNRTSTNKHSGDYSWTDSPGSSYPANANTSISTFIDLNGSTTPVLQYWHSYAFESGVDYGYVEISADGGSSWITIQTITGVDTTWTQERLDLSAWTGSTVGLRFRLSSNGSTQLDGWYIDDITINDGTQIVGYPFFDDMESGIENWFMESPWGLTQSDPYSGMNCWTNSPAGSYINNADESLNLRVDLSNADMPLLTFMTKFSTQVNYDYCRVEVSNDGSNWTVAGYWSGSQSKWKKIGIDLTPWQGDADVFIRWRFTSNSSTVSDGWYVDDIRINETPITDLPYPFYDTFDDSNSYNNWDFAQWEIMTGGKSSPGLVHDSPTGYYLRSGTTADYTNNPNNYTALTTAGVIDLSGAVSPILTFWQKYDIWTTTDGYNTDDDYARVYISTNKGQPGTWVQLYYVNGTGQTSSWQKKTIDLSAYKVPNIRIRFIMDDNRDTHTTYGDQSEQRDGWWIDDIAIYDDQSAGNIVDQAILESPETISTTPGLPTERIYGTVTESGITDGAGQGAGISGEAGFGPYGTYPDDITWKWSTATYLEDDGNADRYFAIMTPDTLGEYNYAYRFMLDGGEWIYADLNGNDLGSGGFNDYQISKAGYMLVAEEPDIDAYPSLIEVTIPLDIIENRAIDLLTNLGPGNLLYALTETDSNGTAQEIPWLILSDVSNTIPANQKEVITATFDPTDLDPDSTYFGYLKLTSNDPDEKEIMIDVVLNTLTAGTAGITGFVRDINDNPIAFATVQISQNDTIKEEITTNSSGYYSAYGLSSGYYKIRSVAEGYYPRVIHDQEVPTVFHVNLKMSKAPEVTPTTTWVDFYSSNTIFDGHGVKAGDLITAFDRQNVACGAFYVHTESSYGLMHIYGDDPSTPGIDEGAKEGDTLTFYINGGPATYSAIPIWTGAVHELDLTVVNEDKIDLMNGYNLISFTMIPEDSAIQDVFVSIDGQYSLVQGFDMDWGDGGPVGARTYVDSLKGLGFNDLTKVDPYHGYWIMMESAGELTVSGQRIYYDTPLPLDAGWNLTAYLPEIEDSVAKALASIHGSFSIVNSFDAGGAHTYVPDSPFNDLFKMKNGYGYWIKMDQEAVLNYGKDQPQSKTFSGPTLALNADDVHPTPYWDDYYGYLSIKGTPIAAGDILEVYDADGIKCGEYMAKYDGQFGMLHVYGDDPKTADIDEGAVTGDVLQFMLNSTAVDFGTEPVTWQGDRQARQINADLVVGIGGDFTSALPEKYELSQNFPNPFNPNTVIRYQLPYPGNVVLSIYNIIGQRINILVDKYHPAGYYNVTWDGTTTNGIKVPTGVYIYRIETGHFSQVRKMILIK